MTLSVFATIRPRPGCLEEAREAVAGIVPATRAEPGCRHFALHEGTEGGILHLTEIWADRAAFEAHHAQPYTRAVFAGYERLLAAPVELTFMRQVA